MSSMTSDQLDRIVNAVEAFSKQQGSEGFPYIAIVIATLSAVAACIALILSWRAIQAHNRAIEAQMIVKSEEDYGALTGDLTFIGEQYKLGEKKETVDHFRKITPKSDWRTALNLHEIPNTDWMIARKIKTFFKRYHKLQRHGFISERALILMINHFGIDLLHDVVRPMDIHRFFFGRRDQKEITEKEFRDEFLWYDEIKEIIKKYDPSIT